jgi:hypothetical protein
MEEKHAEEWKAEFEQKRLEEEYLENTNLLNNIFLYIYKWQDVP